MNKSTLVAVAAFAALALAYVATREKQVSVGIRKLNVPEVAAESFIGIDITGSSAASLALVDGQWRVTAPSKPEASYLADEPQLVAVKKALAEFSAPDFVTDKTDRHAELEVTADKGLTVKARTAAGVVRSLVLGKAAKNGGSYVRLSESNDVFVTTSPLSYLLKKNLTAWRKKGIATFAQGQLKGFTATYPGGATMSLAFEEPAWKLTSPTPAGFRFDAQAAQRLGSQLAGLYAQDFSEGQGDDALGLDAAHATVVTLTLKEGAPRTLTIGTKRPDGTWPLRLDGDAQVYLLPAFQLDAFAQQLDAVRDTTLMKFDPAKVTKVTFTAGAKRAVVTKDGATWKLTEPKTLPAGIDFDPQQVTAQVARLSMLRGARVSPLSEAQAGVAKPTAQVVVTLEGGETQTLRFGAEATDAVGAKTFAARGSIDSLIYAVNAGDKTPFDAPLELFKKPPPPPDFNGARGLDQLPPEIRRQLEAQLRQQQPRN